MDEIIRRSLEAIEANLKADFTIADLASQAGYSTWHFSRLFANCMGQSVAQYMLRRRLDHALAEIAAGRSAIDAAAAYGFETYSGFYRAFVKLYGCSPKRYLSIYGSHTIMKTEVTMKHCTKKEIRQALKHWGMEKADIGDMPIMYDHRPDGVSWRVDGQYLLRTGDRALCMRELRTARALADQGFGATAIVPTLDGQDYLDGEEVFLLSRVGSDEPLSVEACYGPDSPVHAVGQAIARLHAALSAVDAPCDRGDLLGDALGWALPMVQKQDAQWGMGLGERFFADWKERFQALYPALPRQMIHHNLSPSYLLMRDGQAEGFTQFEMMKEEVRLFDVCYAATAILSETADEALYPAWLDVLEALLKGYDSVSPLTAEEKQAVYGLLCAHQMICVAYFGEQEEHGELARRNRAMLTFIALRQENIERML